MPTTTCNTEDVRVLSMLCERTATHPQGWTYDEIRALTGWSRGRIYNLAVRHAARKTEARIQERAVERRTRQAEFLSSVMNTTSPIDVLDFLDGIPDGSCQLVVTSPPYNLGKKYGDSPSADGRQPANYHGWMMQVISECSRILGERGVLCLQVGSTRDWQGRLMPLGASLYEPCRMAGLVYQSWVAWIIPHGLTPRNRLAERHETILVWSKGDTPIFNATPGRTPQKDPAKRAFKGPHKGELSGDPLGAWPTNVWEIPNVGHNHPEKQYEEHPAQFPLELAKRAILL
jgi:DNA modification methylase